MNWVSWYFNGTHWRMTWAGFSKSGGNTGYNSHNFPAAAGSSLELCMRSNESKFSWRVSAGASVLAVLAIMASGSLAAENGASVVATIDGEPITRAQVEASVEAELKSVDLEYARKRHETVEMALGQLMAERLLDTAAAEDGTSREQMLAGLAAGQVTDAEIDAFYEANKARINGSKEQLKEQIRQYLGQQRMQAAYSELVASLQERYNAETLLEPFRIPVEAIGPAMGPADAPVTLVEFSDFECPYCVRIYPTLQQVVKKYGDKVRLVYRQFPLDIHDNAFKAAEASLCADDQGKFWGMHNAMFDNLQAVRSGGFGELANSLGLDMKAFNVCMASGKFAAQVERDMQDGSIVGVTGTPATFVNGRLVSGAISVERLTAMIDEELARKSR